MIDDHLDESIFGGSRPGKGATRNAGPRPATGSAHPHPPTSPARLSRVARRRRALVRAVVLLLTLALVGGAAYVALGFLRPVVSDMTAGNDFSGNGTGATVVTIQQGATGRSIGASLQSAGVVKTAKAFSDALTAQSGTAQIQPGTYRMRHQMSAAAALALLLNPKNRSIPRIVVREGLWRTEIYSLLSKATGTPLADYTAAAARPEQIDLPASAGGNVEGYLFPATYEFTVGTSAAVQLRTMVDKMRTELAALHVAPTDEHRVLVIASIVQAEARRPVDFARVSRVVENRLVATMKLQLDSTVSYAARRRALTTTDAERASTSPWNTYHVAGLPAGPIGNPGIAALQAALHPVAGPWLYFVAVNPSTGETRYAVTAAGHAANEKLFHAWCSAHPGKC